jgi:hypothetical protein
MVYAVQKVEYLVNKSVMCQASPQTLKLNVIRIHHAVTIHH